MGFSKMEPGCRLDPTIAEEVKDYGLRDVLYPTCRLILYPFLGCAVLWL